MATSIRFSGSRAKFISQKNEVRAYTTGLSSKIYFVKKRTMSRASGSNGKISFAKKASLPHNWGGSLVFTSYAEMNFGLPNHHFLHPVSGGALEANGIHTSWYVLHIQRKHLALAKTLQCAVYY